MPMPSWATPIAVCEISESYTRVAHLRATRKAPFVKLLGLGECPTQGLEGGRFKRMVDVTESLWSAAKKATQESGLALRKLTVNLDDPFLESVKVQGSAYMDGSAEEFELKHIQEARKQALQTLHPQDKHLVYQKEAGCLIDQRDYLHDPLGICGKELTVVLQLLFSESCQAQNLRLVVERAGFKLNTMFPSALAALYGAVAPEEMQRRGVVILTGQKACHLLTFEHAAIQDYRSFLVPSGYRELERSKIVDLVKQANILPEPRVFLTGEASNDESWTQDLQNRLEGALQIVSTRIQHPQLESPEYAVLAGLYFLRQAQTKKPSHIKPLKTLWKGTQQRVRSFAEEYF